MVISSSSSVQPVKTTGTADIKFIAYMQVKIEGSFYRSGPTTTTLHSNLYCNNFLAIESHIHFRALFHQYDLW